MIEYFELEDLEYRDKKLTKKVWESCTYTYIKNMDHLATKQDRKILGPITTVLKNKINRKLTSNFPPEHARDNGVSLVRSDWASISALWSKRISTTSTWPAVAAKINGVKPKSKKTKQKKKTL